MIYDFIRERSSISRVRQLCRVLGVSSSAYYRWRAQGMSERARADEHLLEHIRAIYKANRGLYGAPRIHDALADEGIHSGRKRVARLMRQHQIRAKTVRRFKSTTRSDRFTNRGIDRVQRRFSVDWPNRIWSSDITYIPTREGWVYLAVILDLHSRRVVGWELGARLTAGLLTSALERALGARRITPGLILHSDRGSQYTSELVQSMIERHGLEQSFGVSCYDNAVAESFIHTIKTEHIQFQNFQTRDDVRPSLFDYIEVFYNRQRKHSTLAMKSPVQFEEQHLSP
jgi:transposase InsO family protein